LNGGSRQPQGKVVYPNPNNKDQASVNAVMIDAIKAVMSRFDAMNIDSRLNELEKKVAEHEDIIQG
jgi:hypothetical protein